MEFEFSQLTFHPTVWYNTHREITQAPPIQMPDHSGEMGRKSAPLVVPGQRG